TRPVSEAPGAHVGNRGYCVGEVQGAGERDVKGSVVKKGNKYYAVFDLPPEVTIDPETGRTKKKRRQKWVGGYDRKRDAEEALTRFVYQANTGDLAEPSNVTLGEWLDTWLEMEIKPPRRRPGTYERYEQIVRLHLKPA